MSLKVVSHILTGVPVRVAVLGINENDNLPQVFSIYVEPGDAIKLKEKSFKIKKVFFQDVCFNPVDVKKSIAEIDFLADDGNEYKWESWEEDGTLILADGSSYDFYAD